MVYKISTTQSTSKLTALKRYVKGLGQRLGIRHCTGRYLVFKTFSVEGSAPRAGDPPMVSAEEKHFTVEQIAELWNLSRDTVRRIFFNEDGVLKIVRPGTRYKRSHVTLRIPESVLYHVHRRLCAKAA